MLRYWKLFGQPTFFLYDAIGDGGGGGGDDLGGGADELPPTGDHPDFEVPAGVVGADDGQGGGGGDPAGGGRQPVRAGGAPGGQPSGQPDETIPKYRLDEVIQQRDDLDRRYNALTAEQDRLKRLIGASLGIVDPQNPGPKQFTARELAVQKRILELVPGLDKLLGLVDKADVLGTVAESMPDFERQNKQYWGRVARTMFDGMEARVAPLLLGEGKTVADMSAPQRARFRLDFVNWVQADPARIERYESLDMSLVEDFRKDVDETVVQPLRRQFGASVISRGQRVQNLPIAGGGGAPTRTPKPQPKAPMTEDEAADAAWSDLQGRLQATGG